MVKLFLIILLAIPLVHVILSPRSEGGAKVGWFILMLLFSWLAYPVYLIATQKNVRKPPT